MARSDERPVDPRSAAAASETHRVIDAIWRIESPKLIAGLVRQVRDVGTAEDLAQDALVAALEQWPRDGVPSNPGPWLMQAAKRRAIDGLRRAQMMERKHATLTAELEATQDQSPEAALVEGLDDVVGDDLLRLVFITCHPVLSLEARVALTLRLLGGLTTPEIARAFLLPEPTIAQRIVRAKRTLSESRVPFELPPAAELAERTAAVLRVIYLIYNEGYAASSGDAWMRPALAEDAMRLGRVLATLMPRDAEVHGLVALMELQWSRARARTGPDGAPVLLRDQDRSLWDQLLIRRGLAALARAESLTRTLGPYALQAAIAACHARARRPEDTDWVRIVALYDALVELTGSPVVALNRAVAVGMAFGAAEGLTLLDALQTEPALARYHLLASARGEMLEQLGRRDAARAVFLQALELAENAQDRLVLRARVDRLSRGVGSR